MNNQAHAGQLSELVNVKLLTVVQTDRGFKAKAQFLLPESPEAPRVLVRFRQGCNDRPVVGQVWEVQLRRSDARGFIAAAMLRVSD